MDRTSGISVNPADDMAERKRNYNWREAVEEKRRRRESGLRGAGERRSAARKKPGPIRRQAGAKI